jgi:hypothetical protein
MNEKRLRQLCLEKGLNEVQTKTVIQDGKSSGLLSAFNEETILEIIDDYIEDFSSGRPDDAKGVL